MRVLFSLFLAASLSFTSAYAMGDKKQDQHPEPVVTSFKQAYAGYNEAVKAKDVHLTTHYAEHSFKFGKEKYGKDHINTVNLALNWVNSYASHSRGHISPENMIENNFSNFEKATADKPETLLEINLAYGKYFVTHIERNKNKKSLRYFSKAMKILRKHFPENEGAFAQTSLDIGRALFSNYNIPKTETYLKQARDIYSKYPEKQKNSLAVTNFWLAKSYLSSKKYGKAAEAMSQALKTMDDIAPSGQFALSGHTFMAVILEIQGKRDEATKHLQIISKSQPIDVNRELLPLVRHEPRYPRYAQESGTQGHVTLEFTVDEEGFVKNPVAIDGKNIKKFKKAAMEAVVKFRYAPRVVNGQPVSTEKVKTTFTFQMSRR